jgi:ankyrin repeat protein
MSPNAADLMDSVRRGDADAVAEALRKQPSLAGSRDENGVSAFMWASYVRQPAVRDLLRAALPSLDIFETIAAGEDGRALDLLAKLPALANAWSGDGFTALHFAGFFSRPAIAERLLMMSAEVNAVSHNPMRVTPLHSAVSSRCLDVVRLLLAHGASPDAQQESGFTALMAAGVLGDDVLADMLLARGARLDLKHDDGRTAADMAAEKGHTALAARLRGPNPP